MNATLTEIFRATYDWWEIVSNRGEIVLAEDPASEYAAQEIWDAALTLADYDPEDLEASVAVIESVAERHPLLKAGDFVAFGGYGADVVFFRVA